MRWRMSNQNDAPKRAEAATRTQLVTVMNQACTVSGVGPLTQPMILGFEGAQYLRRVFDGMVSVVFEMDRRKASHGGGCVQICALK